MPNNVMENLIVYNVKYMGSYPKPSCTKEFEALTGQEKDMLEVKYQEIFGQ